jgi:hypothetical protein
MRQVPATWEVFLVGATQDLTIIDLLLLTKFVALSEIAKDCAFSMEGFRLQLMLDLSSMMKKVTLFLLRVRGKTTVIMTVSIP